ncbi:MAG: hypothetical protein HYZ54_07485 [Ignavibacteriae bacterium]|nr:hypothetical protein [Ignavibacteriota bacterium]
MKLIKQYWRNIVIVLISIITIIAIGYFSYKLSFEWNKYQKLSFPNFTILSQFLAAGGTILAVVIALFLNSIQRWLEKTSVYLEDNKEFDRNYEIIPSIANQYKPSIIRFFFHLKIINSNSKTTIKDCTLSLQPNKIDEYILDSPRNFYFAASKETSKNISHRDFIDLAFIDIDLEEMIEKGSIIPKLIIGVANHRNIEVDLLTNQIVSFTIKIQSVSLSNIPEFKITLAVDNSKLLKYIDSITSKLKECFKKNTNDVLEKKYSSHLGPPAAYEGFGTTFKVPNILEIYSCIEIKIEKV